MIAVIIWVYVCHNAGKYRRPRREQCAKGRNRKGRENKETKAIRFCAWEYLRLLCALQQCVVEFKLSAPGAVATGNLHSSRNIALYGHFVKMMWRWQVWDHPLFTTRSQLAGKVRLWDDLTLRPAGLGLSLSPTDVVLILCQKRKADSVKFTSSCLIQMVAGIRYTRWT